MSTVPLETCICFDVVADDYVKQSVYSRCLYLLPTYRGYYPQIPKCEHNMPCRKYPVTNTTDHKNSAIYIIDVRLNSDAGKNTAKAAKTSQSAALISYTQKLYTYTS